jgi:hypothetical protein
VSSSEASIMGRPGPLGAVALLEKKLGGRVCPTAGLQLLENATLLPLPKNALIAASQKENGIILLYFPSLILRLLF